MRTFDEQLALVRASDVADPDWYARTYPDVAALGMDPAEHYLRYGAALGRRPGPEFDPAFYRAAYPEVAASGADPLLDYLTAGAARGRVPGLRNSARRAARKRIEALRRALHNLGLVERALAELEALADGDANPFLRAHAAREAALWRLRLGGAEEARAARALLPAATSCPEEPEHFARMAAVEMICARRLGGAPAEADAILARAGAAGLRRDDLLLIRGDFEARAEDRLPWINAALALHGIAPVALREPGPGDARGPAYDRLTCPAPGPAIPEGPLVTVLVAAFEAADTLPTALAGLSAQRWRNLEILVIDDASRDDTAGVAAAHAAADPRIRLIRMETNGGAYVARNRGLAEARGAFVTLHDADDWSHPDKIAAQAEFLLGHPETIGCTSEQARATPDLVFERPTVALKLINMNTSSFLFRRAHVRANYGCWDNVRFEADTELIGRISQAEGRAAVRRIATGPLSFQRVSPGSIVADAHFGIAGTPHGARLIYADLAARRHASGGPRYAPRPAERPFPAPRVMHPDRPTGPRAYDLALACDLAAPTPAFLDEIAIAAEAGLSVAVFPVFAFRRPARKFLIAGPVRDLLQAGCADVVAAGETLACDLLILRDLACFQDAQRDLPQVSAAAARFVLTPKDLAGRSAPEQAAGRARDFVRDGFGAEPDWSPDAAAARAGIPAPAPGGWAETWAPDAADPQAHLQRLARAGLARAAGAAALPPPGPRRRPARAASPLPPRIVLHVGMAKAGSTAVQNFMEAQHDALRDQGVLFPRSILRRTNPLDPSRTPGHLDLIRQILAGEETPLLAECAEAGPGVHTLFLSIENLFNIEPEPGIDALAGFLAGREIALIAVLRAPQDWIASRYYEVVTTGQANETRPIDAWLAEMLATGMLDYPARLARLQDAFTAQALTVLDHGALSANGGVIAAFLDALGVDLDAPEAISAPRVNVSLSHPESLEAHRRLNGLVRRLPLPQRFAFAATMKAHYADLAAQGLLRPGPAPIPAALRAELVAAVGPGCAEIARRWLDGRPFGPDVAWARAAPPPIDAARVAAIQDYGFEAFLAGLEAAEAGDGDGARFAFSAEEARHLRARISEARTILDYGVGDATPMAAAMPGKFVFGVAGDAERAAQQQATLDAAALPSPATIRAAPADGTAGAAGGYPLAPWDAPQFRHPDLIVLGGRFRGACLAAALTRIERPAIALWPDFADRPGPRGLDRLVRPERMIGRMAEFRLEPPDAGGLAAAAELLEAFLRREARRGRAEQTA